MRPICVFSHPFLFLLNFLCYGLFPAECLEVDRAFFLFRSLGAPILLSCFLSGGFLLSFGPFPHDLLLMLQLLLKTHLGKRFLFLCRSTTFFQSFLFCLCLFTHYLLLLFKLLFHRFHLYWWSIRYARRSRTSWTPTWTPRWWSSWTSWRRRSWSSWTCTWRCRRAPTTA